MTVVDRSAGEQSRLAALHRLRALDQPRRQDLDNLARLAAHICAAPTAQINLIDIDRQWPAAAYGYEPGEVARCDSMCATSIESRDVSLTRNAAVDPRWKGNPFTTGKIASVRFYASAPLVVSSGDVIGTICAFSEDEQDLTRSQAERLRDLAELAVQLLELRDETARLGVAALRDPLTGLPNRTLLAESLHHSLARSSREGSALAVIFLDVDGFKPVNDTYGHTAGDQLLRTLADRTLNTMRGSDVVARLGGDEFVVLCDEEDGLVPNLEVITRRIRRAFEEPVPVTVDGCPQTLNVGVSIGAVLAGDHESADEVLLRADAAMYRDKLARKQAGGPRGH